MSARDFTRLSVAVLGDLIADHWLFARPARLSREAPVLVLRHDREELLCGGAANVARNLRALGARVALFGATGRDASGREIAAALAAEGVDVSGVAAVQDWTTPTKTRVLAAEPRRNPQQVLRIDREPSMALPATARVAAAERLHERLGEFDALLVSDYEYGLVGDEAALLTRAFTAAGRIAVLDPRRAPERFRGALTALTPNVGELAAFVRRPEAELATPRELVLAARELFRAVEPRQIDQAQFVPGGGRGEVATVEIRRLPEPHGPAPFDEGPLLGGLGDLGGVYVDRGRRAPVLHDPHLGHRGAEHVGIDAVEAQV